MSVPPDLLVTPAQLTRFGMPPDFAAQFAPLPFLLQVTAGGALGAMQVAWQRIADTGLSAPLASTAVAEWNVTVDDVFADLVFSAGTYILGSTYTVDAAGNVTPSTGGLPTVTASLYDLRQNACSSVTTEAMMRMRDAIRPPLTAWGDDARTHATSMIYAVLKRARGATAAGAGVGDENVFLAEKMGRDFFDDIGKNGKPDSMTDTSPSIDGPLIPVYPKGDRPRGW